MPYTFKDLAIDILKKCDKPLSADEIWKIAVQEGLDKEVGSNGKTPWMSISAQIYTEINAKGDNSRFKQVSNRPALFALKEQEIKDNVLQKRQQEVETIDEPKYNERKLHPVLVKFLNADPHFLCMTKTVFHESSEKAEKNKHKWVHPDLIGVYFPFSKNDKITTDVLGVLNEKAYKIFSFEMKKTIDITHLREYYFQAVSNSSWANEGYLVAPEISNDTTFMEELSILNSAFGIGVIKLNIENPNESEVLFTAKRRDNIDQNMLNKLITINTYAKNIFQSIIDVDGSSSKRINPNDYDEVLDEEKYAKYIEVNNMIPKNI